MAWKVKLSHKMNESRHNQYIKTKSVKLPFKTKNSNISFCFQIFHVNKLWWFVNSNWIYSLVKNKSVKLPFITKNSKHLVGTGADDLRTIFSDMKNKSVKLPFVTKNSKHLVGTGAENLWALIEFTPLWKTKVSNYRL